MSKLETNKQKKREALLNTAFELFTTKGINKTAISDIVERAGVAKGTFYLYFSDKYDIRNKLIAHKASELFNDAINSLKQTDIDSFIPELLYVIDYVVDRLIVDKSLLMFIAKNLGWGVFKKALAQTFTTDEPIGDEGDINFYDFYLESLRAHNLTCDEPEVLLFIIIELVGSTCYSSILYSEPLPIDKYRIHLNETVKTIVTAYVHPVSEDVANSIVVDSIAADSVATDSIIADPIVADSVVTHEPDNTL